MSLLGDIGIMNDLRQSPTSTGGFGAVHAVSLDLGDVLAQPERCPTCDVAGLVPTLVDSELLFTCERCRGTWRPEAGGLVALDVPWRSEQSCELD